MRKCLAQYVDYAISELNLELNVVTRRLEMNNGDEYVIVQQPDGKCTYKITYIDSGHLVPTSVTYTNLDLMKDVDAHIFLYLSRLKGDELIRTDKNRRIYNLDKFSL